MNHSEIVSFLWGVADLIRDTFKRGKYQDVILPLTVLRRLDCVLAGTKEKVLAKQAELRDKKLENLDPQLRRVAGFAFYNTSRYDFEKLLADAPHLAVNLRNYIAGFSPNMREVLEKFDFDNTISKLDEAGLLFQVLERFKNVELHPDKVDNPTMGTIFEELIRKFNEALNENPGEHFTPRDVVHLMVDLMLAGDEERIRRRGVVRTLGGDGGLGRPRRPPPQYRPWDGSEQNIRLRDLPAVRCGSDRRAPSRTCRPPRPRAVPMPRAARGTASDRPWMSGCCVP